MTNFFQTAAIHHSYNSIHITHPAKYSTPQDFLPLNRALSDNHPPRNQKNPVAEILCLYPTAHHSHFQTFPTRNNPNPPPDSEYWKHPYRFHQNIITMLISSFDTSIQASLPATVNTFRILVDTSSAHIL